MYKMIEVDSIPRTQHRRSAKNVNQLRLFCSSGKRTVQLEDVAEKDARRLYNGLKMACRRPEFKGLVSVTRHGNDIYLIRRG